MTDQLVCFFFLRIRRPPRSTLDRSSAASDVYKRQEGHAVARLLHFAQEVGVEEDGHAALAQVGNDVAAVSYTHL